eukprot:gene7618-10372_t
MQFTPQQLAGGPRYSSSTKIGNWYEELALDSAKVSNFRSKSNNGNLSLRKLEHKIKISNELVPHTYNSDGLVRFGDYVILQHDSSGSVLACDTFEEVVIGQEKYLVTTIMEEPSPKARNTFKVVRPPENLIGIEDDVNDPVLRIGQAFMLACNESLLITPNSNLLSPALYLTSTKKNDRTSTKRTNRQMVFMSSVIDSDTIWTAVVPSKGRTNASERFLAMNEPLFVDNGFQITHRQTNMYLTCDPVFKTSTEFGIEYESYCDRSAASGKLGLIVSEFQGLSTSQTLTKPDAPTFAWHFVLSKDGETAADYRNLPVPATLTTILEEIQFAIISKGIDGYWNLRSYLQTLDNEVVAKGKYDREDLKLALVKWGIPLKSVYFDLLLDQVDTRKFGVVDLTVFMNYIRPKLSKERENLVLNIYQSFDKSPSGLVSLQELESKFNGIDHPLVSIGGFSEAESLDHLLKSFETKGKRPKAVDADKFLQYYADLSAAIVDDDYFYLVVRSNWGK